MYSTNRQYGELSSDILLQLAILGTHGLTCTATVLGIPPEVIKVIRQGRRALFERVSYIYFEHPGLDGLENFAVDFGLIKAWHSDDIVLYRGYSKDPYCYVAHKAPAGIAAFGGRVAATEGVEVSDLAPYPGDGRRLTLKTPSGFLSHVLYGQDEIPACESVSSAVVDSLGPFNKSINKQRLGKFVLFFCLYNVFEYAKRADSWVQASSSGFTLGHYGFIIAKRDGEFQWYTSNFYFVPSDVLPLPANKDIDVSAFMHLDLGERLSDHHRLFFSLTASGERDHLHHTSYEVEDFDTQLLGHSLLASKGHEAIFDYCRDPSEFIIEHYTDGDLVNIHTGTKRGTAGPLSVLGPEVLPEMTEDKVQAPAA
ncbi:uncharacterized protein FOBCDRAFT_243057 [Fusarium oxysporum Fo47]|uniref:uncharacterized protein n=1 Tax=Fusarium oxysporum Fo47 TaxID=660027 RepID=UPI002869A79E|nr:uncharacterized protein FOBCDRAFT_243057 [Fusarium oxysporum Fo47]QKD59045.2 hypothetical protein FOBCDRAFT_243057 [Fusarium oxysporum Fo47]